MNNLEKRYVEIRLQEEDRLIQGSAIVFNSESRDMGFVETILPEAITPEVIQNNDIVMLYNHDENAGILARSNKGKGTLKIDINERSVDFSFKARKNSPLSEEVLGAVKEGDLSACSFSFRVAEGGDSWEKRDGKYYRTIKKIDVLRDLSIVSNPAYEETSCRSFELAKEELDKRDLTVNVVVQVVETEEPKEEEPMTDEPVDTTEPMMEEDKCKDDEEKRTETVTEEQVQGMTDEELNLYYTELDNLIKEIRK